MTADSFKARGVPWEMIAVTCIVAAYYALVYRPLSQEEENLALPVRQSWEQLVRINQEDLAIQGLNLQDIIDHSRRVEQWTSRWKPVAEKFSLMADWDPVIVTNMSAPFQLIDFQNERQHTIEQLQQLAKQRAVTVNEGVWDAFPEYSMGEPQPALLFGRMALARRLIRAAVQAQVNEVRSIQLPPIETYPAISGNKPMLNRIPAKIQIIGPMGSIGTFLASLTRSSGAIAAASDQAAEANPALFIQNLMLRKFSRKKPEDVQLDLAAAAFIQH